MSVRECVRTIESVRKRNTTDVNSLTLSFHHTIGQHERKYICMYI